MPNQSMNPSTAAKKLGILLSATPEEFRQGTITRDQMQQLVAEPPAWLDTLRRNGPHPRQEVARKLGISVSGLARAGAADVMTTTEIKQLLQQKPEWLVAERATHALVQDENARIKSDRAARTRLRADRESR